MYIFLNQLHLKHEIPSWGEITSVGHPLVSAADRRRAHTALDLLERTGLRWTETGGLSH